MANLRDQLEEIKAMLGARNSSSNPQKPHKSNAYSTLLSLQEQATTTNDDSSSFIQLLGDSANILVSSFGTDILDNDEEIAAQALKCLGFMIYHPSIVPMITGDNAHMILESLFKVITTTRIKSVCNLGVWCISIQQFNAAILDSHFDSLLRIIIYALDNPIGSISITFEAMQSVIKLATLWGEKMRHVSNVWAPPIYRRLVSADKREREITERCLLKVRYLICPTPVTLSKTILLDVKKKLLPAMKELLNLGLKIETMRAWGWYIRFIGPSAMKSKDLVNEMLKLPEQAFSDSDPQVQIAALVAWEAMIDALVLLPVQASEIDAIQICDKPRVKISSWDNYQTDGDRYLKKLKLIMTPLIGITSSKCHLSVHVACLNTWSYLLHKLETSISSDLVIKSVWEPILELILRHGPDNQSVWLWNICLDVLDAFTSARTANSNGGMHNLEKSRLLEKSSACSRKQYAIKWSPWNLSQLDFFIKMIDIVINQASNAAVSLEFRKLAQNAALKLFRSLLRAVQGAVKCISVPYDEIMLCLNTTFTFLKKICEKVTSEDNCFVDFSHASLQLLELVAEEIEPLILESPLYRTALDLKCLDELEPVCKFRSSCEPGLWLISNMDMVSPIVYLSVLYFSVAVKLTSKASDCKSITDRMCRHVKLSLCSHGTLDILSVCVGLLYKYGAFDCLGIWKGLANGLKDYLDDKRNPSLFKMGSKNHGCAVVFHLLSYPFAACSHLQSQQRLQDIIEVWRQLYVSVHRDSPLQCSTDLNFSENLFAILDEYLNDITVTIDSRAKFQQRDKNQDFDMLLLIGNVISCVMEQFVSEVRFIRSTMSNGNNRTSSIFKTSLGFALRFLKLAFAEKETIVPMIQALSSRLFSTLIQFADSLQLKEDIVAFIEAMTSPLLEWLSLVAVNDQKTTDQLQLLWTKVLNSLRKSRPSIKFDSEFLKFQSSLLEKTLDHWNVTISENTINFWNSTYGEQVLLEYPHNLLPVLDKLSRNGKINICKSVLAISGKNGSGVTSNISPQRYSVTARVNSCSKRVELVGDAMNDLQGENKLHLRSKRKRPDLTEHQKEVRQAQQGRARDCNGHGPGVLTYTSADFSQTNEESQESQGIRDADSILEMLRSVP